MAKWASFNVVIKGAMAAACGGAASALQHVISNGAFVLNKPNVDSMLTGAFLAVLLYFAESPVAKNKNGQQGG